MTFKFKRLISKVKIKYRLKFTPKIFIIGCNKTGTTTLKYTFKQHGFIVGNQYEASKLTKYYHKKNFEPIIEYCKTAEVFQDVPFSLCETYEYLDKAYPNAKFILSVRNSPEQWCDSLLAHFKKSYGKLPTADDMKNNEYIWKGWHWENFSKIISDDENDLFNKKNLIKKYKYHNESVIRYFKSRSNKLLVVNVANPEDFQNFCDFIGVKSNLNKFPWKNKMNNLTE